MFNTENKTAVLILSDPFGGDEALGCGFDALAAAYDFDRAGHASVFGDLVDPGYTILPL